MNNDKINTELLSGENILWQGKPDQKMVFTKSDILLIPFSLLWGGFALFWEANVLGIGIIPNKAPGDVFLPFALFGIPFVLMGLYFIFGRFVYKNYMKSMTDYFVTNQRILISSKNTIRTIELKSINSTTKRINSNGQGSITFGELGSYQLYANTGMDFFMKGQAPIAFYDIDRVEDVYRMIQDLKQKAKSA
jgi:hypothetical protein